jgi:hypothetical protein
MASSSLTWQGSPSCYFTASYGILVFQAIFGTAIAITSLQAKTQRKLRLQRPKEPGKMEKKKVDAVQNKITELVGQIEGMPEPTRSRLMELAQETQQRHDQIKSTFAQLQDGIDCLRLHVKYLMFDLEATRRENADLKRMLKQGD